METYEFGNQSSDIVLIQPIDEHDAATLENEAAFITDHCSKAFRLVAVKISDWNMELSPWEAPAVFRGSAFGNGAAGTLGRLLELCNDKSKTYYIGGYSLAGLFALWAAYQTDKFRGVAAASPSIWFPGFMDYIKENTIGCNKVYLSLGDKEEKTRNPVMATVGKKIREAYLLFKEKKINCILEWNKGNHFKDADIRTAKAFLWLLNEPSA